MLLGCCHCPGDQPSVPPSFGASSGSQASSGSGGSQAASSIGYSLIGEGCDRCSVVASRYKITSVWNSSCACDDSYTGDFYVYYAGLDGGSPNRCVWESAERKLEYDDDGAGNTTCSEVSTLPRWKLFIWTLLGNQQIFTVQVSWRYVGDPGTTSFVEWNWGVALGVGETADCLSARTLSTPYWPGGAFPGDAAGSECTSGGIGVFPTTVDVVAG